jgi:hypothetical protein
MLTPELRKLAATHRLGLLAMLQATQPQLFDGWVLFAVWGWQRIIRGKKKWLAADDLSDYLAMIGDAALDSVILPEGVRPTAKPTNRIIQRTA